MRLSGASVLSSHSVLCDGSAASGRRSGAGSWEDQNHLQTAVYGKHEFDEEGYALLNGKK